MWVAVCVLCRVHCRRIATNKYIIARQGRTWGTGKVQRKAHTAHSYYLFKSLYWFIKPKRENGSLYENSTHKYTQCLLVLVSFRCSGLLFATPPGRVEKKQEAQMRRHRKYARHFLLFKLVPVRTNIFPFYGFRFVCDDCEPCFGCIMVYIESVCVNDGLICPRLCIRSSPQPNFPTPVRSLLVGN